VRTVPCGRCRLAARACFTCPSNSYCNAMVIVKKVIHVESEEVREWRLMSARSEWWTSATFFYHP
jgi:hypothetical protein